MDEERLRDTVKKIEMPDEMRARIIKNCQSRILEEANGIAMNEYKAKRNRQPKQAARNAIPKRRLKAAATVAAFAVSLCLCLTVAGAMSHLGFFQDVRDWTGAVVGTEYEQATDEIDVTVSADIRRHEITIRAVMAHPDILPYRDLETLGIESYEIIDSSGDVVVEGGKTDFFELADGKSEITIPLDSDRGEYRLVITAFVGAKKADIPLPIHGTWECAFSL